MQFESIQIHHPNHQPFSTPLAVPVIQQSPVTLQVQHIALLLHTLPPDPQIQHQYHSPTLITTSQQMKTHPDSIAQEIDCVAKVEES
eukprot:7275616-Ditylum_brightwellii.AAC.1